MKNPKSDQAYAHSPVTPYLSIKDADKAIEFYKDVFGAQQNYRLDRPDGKIAHAQITIGNAPIMLTEACDQMPGPSAYKGSAVFVHLYVDDVDAVLKKAESKNAKINQPAKDQFYGDRSGMLTDPFGHQWYVATQVEDLSPEEIKRRSDKMFEEGAQRMAG